MDKHKIELVCPAGTPAALKVAVNAGADSVYLGFRDDTNARNYPGLNFSRKELEQGVELAHANGSEVFVAINTNPAAGNMDAWTLAVDDAVKSGADAIILSDVGLLDYARNKHPHIRINLSVQAFASNVESINFYHQEFAISRVVLPRIFALRDIKKIIANTDVEIEVFAFAVAGPMAEGRCIMSSYVTGKSPNNYGACSPASCVEYDEHDGVLDTRLNGVLVNQFKKNESAAYPTLCRGRFKVRSTEQYLFENPASLNVINMLQELQDVGVKAIKIEGRQRGKSYIHDVATQFRKAIDAIGIAANAGDTEVDENILMGLCEGQDKSMGAFKKRWL